MFCCYISTLIHPLPNPSRHQLGEEERIDLDQLNQTLLQRDSDEEEEEEEEEERRTRGREVGGATAGGGVATAQDRRSSHRDLQQAARKHTRRTYN